MNDIHSRLKAPPATKFLQLRTLPTPVHHALRVKALEKGISLEQYVADVLADHVGLAPF
jgi:predicted HicB family RNase H-like nuclease